jgi:hypothetical protein
VFYSQRAIIDSRFDARQMLLALGVGWSSMVVSGVTAVFADIASRQTSIGDRDAWCCKIRTKKRCRCAPSESSIAPQLDVLVFKGGAGTALGEHSRKVETVFG